MCDATGWQKTEPRILVASVQVGKKGKEIYCTRRIFKSSRSG